MWWITPAVEVPDLVGVDRKGGRRKPHQVLQAHVGRGVEDQIPHRVAVAQVMVGRDDHPVGQPDLFERLAQAAAPFVTVGGKVRALEIRGAALRPSGRCFPTPLNGTLSRPLTSTGTGRPAAFFSSFKAIVQTPAFVAPRLEHLA